MDRVNSQRENGPKERGNGLKPGNGGQQPGAENPLFSRDFSRKDAAGETVATTDSWRRECPPPPNPARSSSFHNLTYIQKVIAQVRLAPSHNFRHNPALFCGLSCGLDAGGCGLGTG